MATLKPPARSLEQRHMALERANMIRIGRANLKAKVKAMTPLAGREKVAELLHESPPYLATMRLEDLLLMIPRFGDWKVRKLLWAFEVSPRKRVGGLSVRQRKELADMLLRYSSKRLGGGW
jgi:hypothetical protein